MWRRIRERKRKREKVEGNLVAEVWGGFDGIYIGENCRLNLFMRQKHIVSFVKLPICLSRCFVLS